MRWKFWIDRGGTFTDCIGVDPGTGTRHVAKVLSSDRAPLVGIRQILKLEDAAPVPPCDVRMGTTVATNALLERRGRRCALVITTGFADLLEIGTQARPDIFALNIEKPQQLYSEVVEVNSRADANGGVLSRETQQDFAIKLEALRTDGITSLAISVLHAYARPELELELAAQATAAGFEHVCTSHQVANELGFLRRTSTAVLDAYLTPLLREYVKTLSAELPGSDILLMQSSGELAAPEHFRGPAALFSGPAGGVVAYAHVATRAGAASAIGFDMGGTSTDVSRFDGSYDRVYESTVAGVRVLAPMLDIHTVAAGGGSLCRYDGHRFQVGPESAGASPGPLCYGHPAASELTVTDINLFLGRVREDRFPFPLDLNAVTKKLSELQSQLATRGRELSLEQIAGGFLEIANDSMVQAIRQVSLRKGFDVRQDALVVFGGAGGQHACTVAEALGMTTVLFHPLGGVLSAYGMGLSDIGWHGERDAGRRELGPASLAALAPLFTELENEGRAALAAHTAAPECRREVALRYQGSDTALTLPVAPEQDLRAHFADAHRRSFGWARDGHPLEVVVARLCLIVEGIDAAPAPQRQSASASTPQDPALALAPVLSGRDLAAPALQRQSAAWATPRKVNDKPPREQARRSNTAEPPRERDAQPPTLVPAALRQTQLWTGNGRESVPVYEREQLTEGMSLRGPACINEATGSLVLHRGFELTVDAGGLLRATKLAHEKCGAQLPNPKNTTPVQAQSTEAQLTEAQSTEALSTEALSTEALVSEALLTARHRSQVETTTRESAAKPDPIHLELMGNAFMAIAEQMGAALRQTALSTNIRERLDFSCAVFDKDANLLANAPHIPVHLGAMSESVKDVAERHPDAAPGDVFVTNDPAHGGSHLPDITVVTPVFNDFGRLIFFSACRGHHADVGGLTPGSMPPHSTRLSEEGVVLRALPLVKAGRFLEAELRALLNSGPYPARAPEQNLGDLRAQVAANHIGRHLLAELCGSRGEAFVLAYAEHVQEYAAQQVLELIGTLGSQTRRFVDQLDDGTEIAVTVTPLAKRLRVAFDPTPEHAGNSNAPRAVTVAAVMYVLRCLLGKALPLNSGCLRHVDVIIAKCTLLWPSAERAVVSGNVETSQRVVDVLLGAFEAAAASQGTMNNLSFGNETFGYYETIAGGSGGGPGFAGASAVQTHMTNTRITDAEVLESRYPVRLRRFEIRRGSSGAGKQPGGNGVIREFEFLAPLSGTLISERRRVPPFGSKGGGSGAVGLNTLDGVVLPGRCAFELKPGSVLRIETPGGGGYGIPLATRVGAPIRR